MEQGLRLRALQADAQGRRYPAQPGGRHRQDHDQEQGKPLAQAKLETLSGADVIDWFAEEGRRAYGRVVPARAEGVHQLVIKEPVGPVAAFTPWNFPINQAVRKISAALAAGCSIIIKGTGGDAGLVRRADPRFADAGVPKGVVNLVFGVPSEISEYLIPHPIIRKMSFTGSTAVGKHLAALAGQHMKRVTMELGGHGPAVVFEDADVDTAAKLLAVNKFRNAGQVCVSPTRMLVQEPVYESFVDKFVAFAKATKVGDGMDGRPRWGRSPTAAASRPWRCSSPTPRKRARRSEPAASAWATRASSSSRRC